MSKRHLVVPILVLLGVVSALGVGVAQTSYVQGVAGAASSSTNVRPVYVAGTDSGSKVRALRTSVSGVLEQGLHFESETLARVTPLASNGTTDVTIVAGTNGQRVYPTTLVFANFGSVPHTVTLKSSGGTELITFRLTVDGGFALDGRGDVQTLTNEGLAFNIDSGGVATDVKVSGVAIKK